MTTGRRWVLGAAAAAIGAAGCVDRRFVVESNVPGAQIAIDGTPIGPAPTDGRWDYAGCYEFTAVAPGHEPLVQMVEFKPKWYQYPPFDFVAEVIYPFRIEDVRRVRLQLEPTRPVNQAALLSAADALRARGQMLPPSSVPDRRPGPAGGPPPAVAADPPRQLLGGISSPTSDALGVPPSVVPNDLSPSSGPMPVPMPVPPLRLP